MEWLIYVGAFLSVIGLAGLVLSIVKVVRLKGQDLSDEEMRDGVQKVMPLNLGSLFLSVIGLMTVTMGIFLS